MYSFKFKEAETAIKEYQRRHPKSKAAAKALNGDCAAMMELYEKLCGPIDQVVEKGPSDDAVMIIFEAVNRKYTPAMVKLAQVEMCDDIDYWPEAIMMLMDACKLGSQEAMMQLQNNWDNCVKDIDAHYRKGKRMSKYDEFMLAFYYYYGIGTSKDVALAQRLFQSSAKRGCEEAKKMLQDIRPEAIASLNDDVKVCNRNTTMVVRVVSMYPYTCTDADYYEGEKIRFAPDTISASYRILENANQDDALNGREGNLSLSFEYQLHDGQLCAIVDGEFVPCEDDIEFECFLRKRDGEEV